MGFEGKDWADQHHLILLRQSGQRGSNIIVCAEGAQISAHGKYEGFPILLKENSVSMINYKVYLVPAQRVIRLLIVMIRVCFHGERQFVPSAKG